MRVDDRANANAASKMNGVVGKSGKTTPTMPSTKAIMPRLNHMKRFTIAPPKML